MFHIKMLPSPFHSGKDLYIQIFCAVSVQCTYTWMKALPNTFCILTAQKKESLSMNNCYGVNLTGFYQNNKIMILSSEI